MHIARKPNRSRETQVVLELTNFAASGMAFNLQTILKYFALDSYRRSNAFEELTWLSLNNAWFRLFFHTWRISVRLSPNKTKTRLEMLIFRNFNVGKKFQKSLDFVMITELVDYHQFFFIVTMTICSGLPLYNLQALIAIAV